MTCPCCDGPPTMLGLLGRTAWFRCRNCGIDFAGPADVVDDLVEAAAEYDGDDSNEDDD